MTGSRDDDRISNDSVELLVYIRAPAGPTYDNRNHAQANASISFVSAKRVHIGDISWPRKRIRLKVLEDKEMVEGVEHEYGSPKGKGEERRERTGGNRSFCKGEQTPGIPILQDKVPYISQLGSGVVPFGSGASKLGFADSQYSIISNVPDSQPEISPSSRSEEPLIVTPHAIPKRPFSKAPANFRSNFQHLSGNQLLTFSSPAPKISSLEFPLHFSPVAPSQTTISTLDSPTCLEITHPPFNIFTPLPNLVDPPYSVFSPPHDARSNPPQIPPRLHSIVEQGKLLPRYDRAVEFRARGLRKWERGYWKMDLGGWGDAKGKTHFWKLLVDDVKNGRLGEASVILGSEDRQRNWTHEERDRRGNVVKIYCWGGCVEYVWAVLFVYSFRRMKGSVWVDAEGKEVIRIGKC